MPRKILHLDLDAFYPSVELLDDPALAGRPVMVGGMGPRGVVASASYEARKRGVHSAMPMASARRLCPEGLYLPPRFARYRELSRQVFATYRNWTDLVEPLSLDEAFLDVSRRPESGLDIAIAIKEQVRTATGLTVSAGVSCNKFLAKLASAMDKPDGLTEIDAGTAMQRIAPLSAAKLWGVGPATAARLAQAGLHTIGDLAAAEPGSLVAMIGNHGRRLAGMARGEDDRPVTPPGKPRSISAETTFDVDVQTWEEVAPHVRQFVARVSDELHRHELVARTAVLKVRFSDFETVTRSWTPGSPLLHPTELLGAARELARRVGSRPAKPIRLVGFGVANLCEPGGVVQQQQQQPAPQRDLFDPE